MDYLRGSEGYHECIESEQKWGMKENTLQEIEEEQLRRQDNVMRVENERIAERVTEWNSQGIRRRARSVNTWKDGSRKKKSRKLKD
jgi:hypothetical protein